MFHVFSILYTFLETSVCITKERKGKTLIPLSNIISGKLGLEFLHESCEGTLHK